MENANQHNSITRHYKTPKLFWVVFAVLLVLSFVPVIWPQLDLAVAAHFLSATGKTTAANHWLSVDFINGYTPYCFRIMLAVCAVIWALLWLFNRSRHWQFVMAFVVIAGVIGPGLVVNAVVKDNWNRARPFQVQEFGGNRVFTRAGVINDFKEKNSSFVSGHVACGAFFISLMLIAARKRWLWAIVGIAAAMVIGYCRLLAGAHWLSDELWAGPITLLSSWIVWRFLLTVWRRPAPLDL